MKIKKIYLYGNTTSNNEISNKNKILNSFFKIKPENENDNVEYQTQNNNNIVQKYLSNIDDTFLDINQFVCQVDICTVL